MIVLSKFMDSENPEKSGSGFQMEQGERKTPGVTEHEERGESRGC